MAQTTTQAAFGLVPQGKGGTGAATIYNDPRALAREERLREGLPAKIDKLRKKPEVPKVDVDKYWENDKEAITKGYERYTQTAMDYGVDSPQARKIRREVTQAAQDSMQHKTYVDNYMSYLDEVSEDLTPEEHQEYLDSVEQWSGLKINERSQFDLKKPVIEKPVTPWADIEKNMFDILLKGRNLNVSEEKLGAGEKQRVRTVQNTANQIKTAWKKSIEDNPESYKAKVETRQLKEGISRADAEEAIYQDFVISLPKETQKILLEDKSTESAKELGNIKVSDLAFKDMKELRGISSLPNLLGSKMRDILKSYTEDVDGLMSADATVKQVDGLPKKGASIHVEGEIYTDTPRDVPVIDPVTGLPEMDGEVEKTKKITSLTPTDMIGSHKLFINKVIKLGDNSYIMFGNIGSAGGYNIIAPVTSANKIQLESNYFGGRPLEEVFSGEVTEELINEESGKVKNPFDSGR
jgi:hypothetical protein